jgi:hypothetical protein
MMAKDPAAKVARKANARDHRALADLLDDRDAEVGELAARALDGLLTDPAAVAARHGWSETDWAFLSYLRRQADRSTLDLSGLVLKYETERHEHLARVDRVTAMWEQWDGPAKEKKQRIKDAAKYAALMEGDERIEHEVGGIAFVHNGVSREYDGDPNWSLKVLVTDKRLVATGSYPIGLGFNITTPEPVSGSVEWEAVQVERTVSEGDEFLVLSWDPTVAFGNGLSALVYSLPSDGRPSLSSEKVLRALATHLPAVAELAADTESTALKCDRCGREWAVLGGPVPRTDLTLTQAANGIGHPCRSCGAFFCLKEKRKLGGKFLTDFEDLTCSKCGAQKAFPLMYWRGVRTD